MLRFKDMAGKNIASISPFLKRSCHIPFPSSFFCLQNEGICKQIGDDFCLQNRLFCLQNSVYSCKHVNKIAEVMAT